MHRNPEWSIAGREFRFVDIHVDVDVYVDASVITPILR
ncbi:MAG: hypothetical protein J07HQW1_03333 [Haloquadratum walsbyi J07HQW1]|uniref:Uncharacterized protein n=1 Tax=Haloquadratum walsbyi J07HQW1 TaxID=1238424 RepID=U1PI04_9EURY|nr:MAG: hypothetical protein J07HQW1_03333 [Haloquadratum walsbyi J07HQW1]